MIKQCPTCNRTYSDETISFCLADGSLLSSPFDHKDEGSRKKETPAPPTEVMPAPPLPRPTQPSPQPTITAPPPNHARLTASGDAPPASKRSLFLGLILAAVLLLAGLIAIFLIVSRRGKSNPEVTATAVASPSPNTVVQLSESPSTLSPSRSGSSPKPGSISPVPIPAATPSPKNSLDSPTATPKPMEADPVLFPPDTKTIDYNKVFSSKETDQPARILSRPQPSYTDTARMNQISGVVLLRAVFSSAGEVTNITVVRGLPDGLSERAIAAARQIKFEPARKDGRPVSTYVQIQYNFNLY